MGGREGASIDSCRLIALPEAMRSWVWIHAVHRIVALRILTTGHVADDVSETWGKHGNDAVLCQCSLRLNLERIFHRSQLTVRSRCPGSIPRATKAEASYGFAIRLPDQTERLWRVDESRGSIFPQPGSSREWKAGTALCHPEARSHPAGVGWTDARSATLFKPGGGLECMWNRKVRFLLEQKL